MIFVRDQERSLRFYLDQLRFRLVVDQIIQGDIRWIEVAPPDGSANIALAKIVSEADHDKLVGRDTNIYFLTEDVVGKFNEWNARGVKFQFPPENPAWGGTFTRFEDPDGNSFGTRRLRRAHPRSRSATSSPRQEVRDRASRRARDGNRQAGAGPALPANSSRSEDAGIRWPLPSGAPGWRRLLRLPRSRPAATWTRNRRRLPAKELRPPC